MLHNAYFFLQKSVPIQPKTNKILPKICQNWQLPYGSVGRRSVLTHPEIHIKEDTTIYSINEANFPNWDSPLQKVVNGWQTGTGASGKKYTSRYMGSMVGDVHRTFMYGGVFGYPADTKNKNGKLPELFARRGRR